MKVYCEESDETHDIEASSAQRAAEIACARDSDGSGGASHYRVEYRPGCWARFAVYMEMRPVFETRGKGACDPPPGEDDDEGEGDE